LTARERINLLVAQFCSISLFQHAVSRASREHRQQGIDQSIGLFLRQQLQVFALLIITLNVINARVRYTEEQSIFFIHTYHYGSYHDNQYQK
jgi:hypothetical protein